MQIQKTIGVVEALDERIKLIKEDIAEIEKELAAAKVSNVGAMAANVARSAALVIFRLVLSVVAGLFTCYGGVEITGGNSDLAGPVIVGSLVLTVVAFFVLTRIMRGDEKGPGVDTAALESKLAALRQDLETRQREKRELVLGFERQIKSQSAPVPGSIEDEIATASADEKMCPMCAETVKAKAIICKHCGHRFDGHVTSQ